MRPVAAFFCNIPRPCRPLETKYETISSESTALQMAVRRAVRSSGVIPIRRSIPISETAELVADVAYRLWLSSPFGCGPPEEAFTTALRLVKGKSASLLFLVPRRNQHHHLRPIITMKESSKRRGAMKTILVLEDEPCVLS